MTDESPQLSRRERRAQEARDAARRAEDTAAIDMSPISESIPTHSPDGRVLTRRERRRLERLQSPVETWTAEEEMIATGQIPAMTPERIAEQERLAREKAEQAQREALTASAELDTVEAPDEAPADEEAAEAAPPEAPQRSSLLAAAADSGAAHDDDADDGHDDDAVVDSTDDAEAAAAWAGAFDAAEPLAEPAPQTQGINDEAQATDDDPAPEPDAQAGPEPEPEPEPAEDAGAKPDVPTTTPLGMPPGMSPEMFAALFPPGSLQRRLMEQQNQPAEPPATPPASDPAPVEADARDDGDADEIRRLSHEAVAGIDSASSPSQSSPPAGHTSDDEHDEAQVDDLSWKAEQAPGDSAPAHPPHVDSADAVAPEATQALGQAPSASSPQAGPDSEPVQLDAQDFRQSHPSSPSAPSFEAILGTGDPATTAALDNASTGEVSAVSGAFATVDAPSAPAVHAASSAADVRTPAAWGSLPLSSVEHRAQELPEVAPREDIAHPDLSSVGRHTFSPQGDFSHIEPVPTGQIEVPPREKPELSTAGGPRHFRWVHVLVLGAVAFLIGVVVWNVWGGPS